MEEENGDDLVHNFHSAKLRFAHNRVLIGEGTSFLKMNAYETSKDSIGAGQLLRAKGTCFVLSSVVCHGGQRPDD